jgi:hypothetical protein
MPRFIAGGLTRLQDGSFLASGTSGAYETVFEPDPGPGVVLRIRNDGTLDPAFGAAGVARFEGEPRSSTRGG